VVDVADPLGGFLRRAGPKVQSNLGAGSNQFAEMQVLVGAEGVVLGNAPSFILHARAFVARPDSVAPVVSGGEISTETQQRRADRFSQGDNIGIHTIDVVVGK